MSWTLTFERSPQGSNSMGNVDDEIRALKSEIKTLLGKEHYFDVPASGGVDATKQLAMQGRHRAGNAKLLMSTTLASFPVANPDGTAFTEADDGKLVWVYQIGWGLRQYMGYWKNNQLNWWPIFSGGIGEFCAVRDGVNENRSYPMDLDKNSWPGWLLCDGTSYDLTYDFGGSRQIRVTGTLPDLRERKLRGAATYGGALGTGGSKNPKMTAAMLAQHAHGLNAGTAGLSVSVGDHSDTQLIMDYGGGSSRVNLFGTPFGGSDEDERYVVLGRLNGGISRPMRIPILSHGVSVGMNGNTNNAGSATPTDLPDYAYQDVNWLMRVI